MAESAVKHFKRGLRKLQARYGDDWPLYFYDLLFAHRICVRGATLFSAFQMVYGRPPVLPVERLFAQRYQTRYRFGCWKNIGQWRTMMMRVPNQTLQRGGRT